MALVDYVFDDVGKVIERDKVAIAIDRLKAFEPPEGYYLAFSGGKDSQCIYHLAQEAGVKFDAHYNLTTVDPPELVYFIRDNYPDVIEDKPPISMWKLIVEKKMPPTRLKRYCCSVLKESSGEGRVVVTGVRWAESIKRKNRRNAFEIVTSRIENRVLLNDNTENRRLFENCTKKGRRIINPIIDWETEDVWEYIRSRGIKYCELYDQGYSRLGCIGCPMSTRAAEELEKYPKYKSAYLRAFQRMIDERCHAEISGTWRTPEDVMAWWVDRKRKRAEMVGEFNFEEWEDGLVDG